MRENEPGEWRESSTPPKAPLGAPAPADVSSDLPGEVESLLRKTQEQLARLERTNQTLVRGNQRAEQLNRRHEESLSLVANYGSDFLFRLGKDLKIRFASRCGAEMLGVEPSNLEGRAFLDLLPQADRGRVKGFLQETLRAEKVERLRLSLHDGQGRLIEVDCFFRTVPHPQTQAPELLGLARRLAPDAAPPDPPIGELGARLAHELSQPLTAIGTTSRVCARRLRDLLGPDHEVTQAIEQMADQSERATELIRRLRQLSLGAPPHRSSVQLNQLAQETVDSLRTQLKQAKAEVVFDLASDLPLIQGDAIQLGQVLLNLIRNALEAMMEAGAGPRRLTIASRRRDGEVEVSVADNGPGVAAATAAELFQPYQTTKPHGMGLGLALCRSILTAHKGRLWVEANQPSGAIFLFALPTQL